MTGASLVFGVLGPLRVTDRDRPIRVPSGRLSVLLALLLVRANRVVPAEELIDRLWGQDPPGDPRRTLHLYIARLRRALGPTGAQVVRTEGTGYVVHASADTLDLLRFTELVERAETVGDDRVRSSLLSEAAALWQRPVLGNVQVDELRAEIEGLEEQWVHTVERRIAADLALGRHHEVVAELVDLVERLPLRERLWEQLMTALYRSGRQADALTTYQRVRARLAEDLGVDPGPDLQLLHRQILTADPALTAPIAAGVGLRAVPAQLPADSAAFTGRTTELDHLLAIPDGSPRAVVISAIDGMAGIGKTALAVHAAHRLAEQFPDGQIFLDLHGFTDGIAPVDPADALDRILRALGVAAGQIPKQLDDRAALYRTILAPTRTLVVLDNAATESQVHPLLPGARGCLVLITSRRRLARLDAATTLSLDPLPPGEAAALFAQAAALTGTPTEPLEEIVELCGRLPLAIRIAAARLRAHPAWTPRYLAERLRDQDHRLTELDSGRHGVEAALDLSYQELEPDRRRAYRLLGTVPGPDTDLAAITALLGTTAHRAGLLLEDLLDAHLLTESARGRYRLHDLVRAHAVAAANRFEPQPQQFAAISRLLDHYAHTARAVVSNLYPAVGGEPRRTESDGGSATWLDIELPNLIATAQRAASRSLSDPVVELSTVLYRHLTIRGFFAEGHALATCALSAARTAGNAADEVHALTNMGNFDRLRGRYESAADSLRRALDLARHTEDRRGELGALTQLAYVNLLGGAKDATDSMRQALDLARELGDRDGEQTALTGLGNLDRLQGRHEAAAGHLERALRLARELGSRDREIDALNGLSYLHRERGDYPAAVTCSERSLALARETGDRTGELLAVHILAHLHRLLDEPERAVEQFDAALALARDLGHLVGEIHTLAGLGDVHRLVGRHELAHHHYQRALSLARQVGERNGEFEALLGLGRTCLATGRADAAVALHQQALDIAERLDQPFDQARAHDGLALAHVDLGDPDTAGDHWRRALAILTDLGIDHADGIDVTDIRAQLKELARPCA